MKAVVCSRYGPPEVLQLREVDQPVPKSHEVCVRIRATAVTSSDCIVRSGRVHLRLWFPMRVVIGFRAPRKPLGMVLAGDVVSVGKDVESFRPGDEVFGFDRFGFATYAQFKCISQRGLLALHYLKRGGIQDGQRVLIYGASGAVGTSAVQLAKHFGASVVGVCSTANLDLVASLGAESVIDYTKEDFLERGDLYDLIFDAVPAAHRTARLEGKGGLTPGGKYVSVTSGSPAFHHEDLALLKELTEAGQLQPVIDRTYPIEQIVEAHRYVDTGHKKGNVVITVG